MTEHISKQYDQDLEAIRSRMMQMGGLVESQIRAAIAGLGGDASGIEQVIATDAKVNELEVAIDEDLRQVIVRRQPAASDLRLIVAVSKAVTDLERIGDEATKIARMAREIQAGGRPAGAQRLAPPGHLSDIAVGLKRNGHEVRRAASAADAWASVVEVLPDVILLDWMLPDASGPSLARRIRGEARTRDVPIIMLTARAGDDDKVAGLQSGVDDYVTKPFSPRELEARIQAVLRRRAPQLSKEEVAIEGL